MLRLVDGLEVAALMDVDTTAARAWARVLGGPPVLWEFDRLLREAPLDALLITSPLAVRWEQACAALEAGVHVLCEVPLARSVAECDQLLAAATRGRALLMPAFARRFERAFGCVRESVAVGELGERLQARCDWSFYSPWGERRVALRTWQGVFREHAHQTVDLCRWWLDEVETVSADVDEMDGALRAADQANLILTHSGGISVHHISRTTRRSPVEQYILEGTGGSLHLSFGTGWSHDSSEPCRVTRQLHGEEPEDLTPASLPRLEEEIRRHHPYKLLLDRFVAAARDNEAPGITGTDGRKALEVLEAARMSTVERAKIALPLSPTGIGPRGFRDVYEPV